MNFKIDAPPVSVPDPEALAWARQAGYEAGMNGLPPTPPQYFAGFARPWGEGWQAATDRRKSGWASLNIDYQWQSR